MKIKNKLGLIICKKEFEEKVKKTIKNEAKEYGLINKAFFSTQIEKKGWIILQIFHSAFKNYSYFDDFLLQLSDIFYSNNNILVIGHNDEQGFIWKDYN